MRFRKKPVVIEAELYDGSKESIAKVLNMGGTRVVTVYDGYLTIKTLEGKHSATKGDWIIKGVQGELYPCKPDIFEQTYDKVE